MPRPGNMSVTEKSKDFKGSLIKLFNYLDKWRLQLVLGLVLALCGAIFSTIAPSKLSDLTDVITEGIKPNTANITKLSESIKNNTLSGVLAPIIIDDVTISVTDQNTYLYLVQEYKEEVFTNTQYYNKLPDSVKKIVEPKLNMDSLKNRAVVLGTIYLLGALCIYFQGIIMVIVSNNFAKKLRTEISKKINRLPLKYFDTHETGDLLSRITNDVDAIGTNIHHSASTMVSNVALFFGSLVMMFVTNWIMALTAIIASAIGFGVSFIILKESQKYFVKRQEELGKLNGHIEEIYSGHIVVKTYNGEKEALREFDKINDELYESNQKSQFLSGIMQPVMGFIGNLGYVAVCVMGAILTMNNIITFGTIVAFMIYIRLFTNPLSQIAQAMTGLQSTAASAERVFEFLEEPEQSDEKDLKNSLAIEDAKGNIVFDHVKFGYNSSETIIKDFNAEVKPGMKVAIVGPTGAGKTTLVNLLMKFYEINSGNIIIDGKALSSLTRENIHDLFVMVLQDTWLFDGTIKDNIRFNQKNVTDQDIWDACKTVGIDHFIKTLPGGLNAKVGDNGIISSGQKQLITIARGMIKNGPFLILDEATSNVDTRTEELVQKAMDKLTEGKTSFIIAHRLSTIKNADLILVIDNGNIVEQGTHKALLKKNGYYASLYNSQFEQFH
jgi:ATP-binding cassette subfamily B protein